GPADLGPARRTPRPDLSHRCGPHSARSTGSARSGLSSHSSHSRPSSWNPALVVEDLMCYRYLTITRGSLKLFWQSTVHRSFIRSDFVTMPVTSPFAVTSTAS